MKNNYENLEGFPIGLWIKRKLQHFLSLTEPPKLNHTSDNNRGNIIQFYLHDMHY